jgi:MoaA/NifB/PqqE/SkfB family radical SAM enzyme
MPPAIIHKRPSTSIGKSREACTLACRHCRAEASPNADPNQLTFDQGIALLRQIKDFGDPLPQLILTGGDPLARPDLFELIDEANKLGIGVSITPATTPASRAMYSSDCRNIPWKI